VLSVAYTPVVVRLTAAVRALIHHPGLWGEALRATFSLTPSGWWRRPPFLPRPDAGLLAWRIATAYGNADAEMSGEDLVGYLRWRRVQRGLR
jgi:hypothetical protein